jgi:hypothetical protein
MHQSEFEQYFPLNRGISVAREPCLAGKCICMMNRLKDGHFSDVLFGLRKRSAISRAWLGARFAEL